MASGKGGVEVVEEKEWLEAIELSFMGMLPMAMKTAISLGVLEILQSHGVMMSAEEIVSKMPHSSSSTSISYLDRILRLLSSHSFFTTSLDPPQTTARIRKRRYGLAPKSKYFVRDGLGRSLSPFLFLLQNKVLIETWHHLDEAVLDGGNAFLKAHGKFVYHYAAEDPRFAHVFWKGMESHSLLFVKDFLKIYRGFDEEKSGATLVDVGGGSGACLSTIVSKYPNMRGINFDLPHVVSASPAYPGVEHIGGDMFETIPIGDIILMKWILHNWEDEECVKILTNCHKALKPGGKVILLENMFAEALGTDMKSHIKGFMDLIMILHCSRGKERTKEQYKQLAISTGFGKVVDICVINELCVIEFHRT